MYVPDAFKHPHSKLHVIAHISTQDTTNGQLGCAVLVPGVEGTVTTATPLSATQYVDAQLLAYNDAWLGGGTRAKIAAIALGADGVSNFTTSLAYLKAAGLEGVDMVSSITWVGGWVVWVRQVDSAGLP